MVAAELYCGHWRRTEAFMVIFSPLASHKHTLAVSIWAIFPYPVLLLVGEFGFSGMCGIYLVISKGL